jgi:hypothetical protein
VAQDRDKWGALECGNEPSGSIKFWESIKWLHNSHVVLSSIELVKEIGIKVNIEDTKHTRMLSYRHQTAGQIYVIKISKRSFVNMAHLKNSGKTVVN